MARSDDVFESHHSVDHHDSPPQDDKIAKETGVENGTDAKEPDPSLIAIDEPAAIPKGTIDPVYEAKARVLNHAVRSARPA